MDVTSLENFLPCPSFIMLFFPPWLLIYHQFILTWIRTSLNEMFLTTICPMYRVSYPHLLFFILEPLIYKVGFYMRHLDYGLRLPADSFFLEVLCSYGLHLIQLCPNVVSKVISFEVFCVVLHIPLHVPL